MARYIDAEQLMEEIDEVYKDFDEDAEKHNYDPVAFADTIRALGLAKTIIYNAPTVILKPVHSAHWFEIPGIADLDYCCSRCGWATDTVTSYCGACGAEMDLDYTGFDYDENAE